MALAPRNFRASRDDPRLRNRADTSGLLENQAATDTPNQSAQAMRQERSVEQQPTQPERNTPVSRQQAQQEAQQQVKRGFERQQPKGFLSNEDILQSYKLQKLGAEEGDRIVNGQLERLVSPDPRGEVLAQFDIQRSQKLQELGAEPGDIIEDGKLIKSGKNSFIRNLNYAATAATGPLESFGDLMNQYFPIPNIEIGGTPNRPTVDFAFFDEEFVEGTPEQRRDLIEQYKEAELAEIEKDFDFRPDIASGRTGSFFGETGPLSFVPLTAGTRMGLLMAEGAAFGVGDLTIETLAEEGELPTLAETGEVAALGSAFGLGGSLVIAGAKRVAGDVARSKSTRIARETQEDFEETVSAKVALGEAPAKAAKNAQEELGISDDYLKAIANLTGRKARIPSSQKKARDAARNDIANNSATSRQRFKSVDRILGAISTRIKNVSPAVAGRLRNYEAAIHYRTAEKLQEITPFVRMYGRAPKRIKDQLDLQLLNGNFDAARGLFRTYAPNDLKLFDEAIDAIKRTGDELEESGYDIARLQNYFPRLVKDLDGLRSSLGREKRSRIDDALRKTAESKNVKISDLSIDERSAVIDKVLRGYSPQTIDGKLSFTKPRTIEKIEPEQLKFYEDPASSLQQYMRKSVDDIEKRNFFGRSATTSADGTLDTNSSIGRLVDDARQKGTITPEGEQDLQDMLSARFGAGEKGPSALIQTIRDIGYGSTIANPYTALINLDELSRSAAIYGFSNTLTSLFGRKFSNTVELGIKNASKEFDNPERSSRFLRSLFNASGFTRLDQLGKNVQINASLRKNFAKAQTAKGRSELRKKYQSQFGDETETLIRNLQDRNVTDNVKTLAFSELSDMQPISRSEMSETYLNNPNGRIFYQLKSFTLKQYDLVRNQIVREFKQGNKAEATKKAAALMAYMTASGTTLDVVRDLMLGREVRPENLPNRAMWALLAPYGLNRYVSRRYLGSGDVKGFVTNQLAPATPLLDELFSITANAGKYATGEEELSEDLISALNSVPVVGKLAYNWLGGGAEKYNERLDEEE